MTQCRPNTSVPLGLTARVARRYFLDGRSKVEIADEFDLSRFAVARLLHAAREIGLVKITVDCPGPIDVELSSRLRDAFDLTYSVVVHDEDAPGRLAGTAAELLSEVVGPEDVLGVACAPALAAMGASLRKLSVRAVVQLTGSTPGPRRDSSTLVLLIARVGRGAAYVFDAPVLLPDATSAAAQRRKLDVARASRQFGNLTKAVVGVGAWRRSGSPLYDALDPAEAAAWGRAGACAEVAGSLIAADGTSMTDLQARCVGVRVEQIRAVPEVIGVVDGDVGDRPAVAAALAAGVLNGLVTHRSMAAALLGSATPPAERHSRGSDWPSSAST